MGLPSYNLFVNLSFKFKVNGDNLLLENISNEG